MYRDIKGSISFVSILFITTILLMGAMPSVANTIESSTMVFQGSGLTDNGDGTYTGILPMIPENGTGLGDGEDGYDILARDGSTAYFGNDPGSGPVWTPEVITERDSTELGGTPDTPDWYQYSIRFYEEDGIQKWALRNHAGATSTTPWSDAPDSYPARGVPMSGTMDWDNSYAEETDTGAYLPGKGTPEIAGGAANNGGGAHCWDMDWSWGSEVVPLAFPGFDVEVTKDVDVYTVTLTPAKAKGDAVTPGPVVNQNTGESFGTIQAAVNVAESGDIIEVIAASHNEGIVQINKDITITGAENLDRPVINPSEDTGSSNEIGSNGRGWFQIHGGARVVLENLSFNGENYNIHTAVHFHSDCNGGSVKDCCFKNIKYSSYEGRGINNYGGNVNILNSDFHNIQRIGVFTFNAEAYTHISECAYTGKGEGDYLDYAFEAGAGGHILVENCMITECLGEALSDGSVSSGILATDLYGGGTKATIIGNKLTNNIEGIYVGYDDTDQTEAQIYDNYIVGNINNGIIAKINTIVDATDNWWGDNRGPFVSVENEITSGDVLSGDASYEPWLYVPADQTDGINTSDVSFDVTITDENDEPLVIAEVETSHDEGELVTVAIAHFEDNLTGEDIEGTGVLFDGAYYDLKIPSECCEKVTSITLKIKLPESYQGEPLPLYYIPAEGWLPFEEETYEIVNGYLTITLTDESEPSISDFNGTPIAISEKEQEVPPTPPTDDDDEVVITTPTDTTTSTSGGGSGCNVSFLNPSILLLLAPLAMLLKK